MGTLYFSIDELDVISQKSVSDHSDNDWLSIFWIVRNPKTGQTNQYPVDGPITSYIGQARSGDKVRHREGQSSNSLIFSTNMEFHAGDCVTFHVTVINLGSSDLKEQISQAERIGRDIVKNVAPKVIDVMAQIYSKVATGGLGVEGVNMLITQEAVKQIANIALDVTSSISDFFDSLGISIGPTNCNGEVFHLTVLRTYEQLMEQTNHYQQNNQVILGPVKSNDCGGAPQTGITYAFSLKPDAAVNYDNIHNARSGAYRNKEMDKLKGDDGLIK